MPNLGNMGDALWHLGNNTVWKVLLKGLNTPYTYAGKIATFFPFHAEDVGAVAYLDRGAIC